jgi:nucleoid DNA-binding protein
MNKNELIKEISALTGAPLRSTSEMLDTLLGVIADQLYQGGEVCIANFGRFSTRTVPAHDARNPQDSSVVHVPEKTVVRFKAFSGLMYYAKKHA